MTRTDSPLPAFLQTDHAAFLPPRTLTALDRQLTAVPARVVIGDEPLTVAEVLAVARHDVPVDFTTKPATLERLAFAHANVMVQIADGVPIYGCNTGYGAQGIIEERVGSLRQRIAQVRGISEGIVAIDMAVGPPFATDVVRAGMLIRAHMLMAGVSGVKLADLEAYRQLLNRGLTPYVQQFGGLGASGDLAQNARVLSCLRQLPGSRITDREGRTREARDVLREAGLEPLVLDPKAGLGLCNGDNFSTGLAMLVATDTLRVLLATVAVSALVVEVLHGTTRAFHPLLAAVRPHDGQAETATLLRELLQGSQLARQELDGPHDHQAGRAVQDGYSLRGLAQFLGVSAERVRATFAVVTRNANAVSDNPLWVPETLTTPGEEPWQWVSGANFLAMHMAEALDGLRKTLTHIVKLCDRHLARMVNPHFSNGLPANLSDPAAVTHCAFKGVQIQAGMFEVYSQLLSIPVTTFFGVHEEGNQDITSHALTSGIMALENLRLARYAVAQNLLAVAQAVDLRGGPALLAPRTRPIYDFVRQHTDYVSKERPLHLDIERLYTAQTSDELGAVVRTSFAGL